VFDIDCRQCPRLAEFLDQVKQQYPNYHARPVAPFGDEKARVLIVGLAPGMHGANASGRPFTGDFAGILLYETLYKYGFSNQPESTAADDNLRLINCRITNAVKCLPPQNKPVGSEINSCNKYLSCEINDLHDNSVVVVLGSIAHNAVVKALSLKQSDYKFGHNNLHQLPRGLQLLDSYHCSRYNTQTRRLTEAMFHQVFERARSLIDGV
jgi:uracil-DNA glycosylase family 4